MTKDTPILSGSEPERQMITLKADIAYAIGRFEGLGYPSEYLKRRYPEFTKLVGIDEKLPAAPTEKGAQHDHS